MRIGRARFGYIVVLVAAGAALVLLFGNPRAPGRKFAYALRSMECFKQPADGGIAAIGDSITAGIYIQEPGVGILVKQSWFARDVCDEGLPYSYNAAVPGETTRQLRDRVDDALRHHPRVVVVLAGTNDVLQSVPPTFSVRQVRTIVDRLRRARVIPLLATIPPQAGRAKHVEALNRALEGLASAERLGLIDFHRVLSTRDGAYKPGFSTDGIHPSNAGAEVMARAAAPVLKRALARAS